MIISVDEAFKGLEMLQANKFVGWTDRNID